MGNFEARINLSKLKNSVVTELKGQSGQPKRCLVIPLEDAGLFEGKEGVYLNIDINENREVSYGNTHSIKQHYDKEKYQQLTDDEKKVYLGNMKPNTYQQANSGASYTEAPSQKETSFTQDSSSSNDLPF